jgi:hypothetical protein
LETNFFSNASGSIFNPEKARDNTFRKEGTPFSNRREWSGLLDQKLAQWNRSGKINTSQHIVLSLLLSFSPFLFISLGLGFSYRLDVVAWIDAKRTRERVVVVIDLLHRSSSQLSGHLTETLERQSLACWILEHPEGTWSCLMPKPLPQRASAIQ